MAYFYGSLMGLEEDKDNLGPRKDHKNLRAFNYNVNSLEYYMSLVTAAGIFCLVLISIIGLIKEVFPKENSLISFNNYFTLSICCLVMTPAFY